jgi:hypothetical protein
MNQKIYVGKGKTIGNFGQIKLNICTKDFNGNNVLPINEKGYLKPLILTRMKSPDKHGNEYTIFIDDFVPKAKTEPEPTRTQEDDLPF